MFNYPIIEWIELVVKFFGVLIPVLIGVFKMIRTQSSIKLEVENISKNAEKKSKEIDDKFSLLMSRSDKDRGESKERENSFTGAVNSMRQQFKGVETSIGRRLDNIERDLSSKIHSIQLDIAKNHLNRNDKTEMMSELDKLREHVSSVYLKKENADIRYGELRDKIESIERRTVR